MGTEEKNYKLFVQGKDGEIVTEEISQEQLGRIFFSEGNREWDNVHMVLPRPVWERIYQDGSLVYEGFTVDHKAFGAGRAFFGNGKPRLEGIFGLKGLICGREYYSNGVIRFEGQFRLNQAYGPNYPEYGIWYDENGKMLYRGKIHVTRSSLGWPSIYKPEGFGKVPFSTMRDGPVFLWEDARKYKNPDAVRDPEQTAAEEARKVIREVRNEKEEAKKKTEPEDSYSPKYIQALLERLTPWSLTEEHAKLLQGKSPAEQKKIRDRLALDIIAEYPYKPNVEIEYREALRIKRIDERNWLEHLDEMTNGEITFMLEQLPGLDGLNKNRRARPEIPDRIRAEFLRDFG